MSEIDEEKKPIDANDEDKKEGDDLDLDEEEDKSKVDEDELDKPLTRREWIDYQEQQKKNRFFAEQRRADKTKNYQGSNKSEDNPIESRLTAIEINSAKIAFATQHGLNGKEIEYVWKFTNGKPNAKSLEDPFIKGGLENLRTSNNLKENMSSGSGASTFEVEGKKWDDLKSDEKQSNFQAKQRAILSGKKR